MSLETKWVSKQARNIGKMQEICWRERWRVNRAGKDKPSGGLYIVLKKQPQKSKNHIHTNRHD